MEKTTMPDNIKHLKHTTLLKQIINKYIKHAFTDLIWDPNNYNFKNINEMSMKHMLGVRS